MQLIGVEWQAPGTIRAAMTTRHGGSSQPPYDSLNLGYATRDDRSTVMANETAVAVALGVESRDIRWVYQVHGVAVHHAEALPENAPLGGTTIQGDAIVCHTPGLVCGIKVADCMPVLLASRQGHAVGAAHAGWRGLAGGVVENTLAAMRCDPADVVAWLGPCIGPEAFEVGEDVRAAFIASDAAAAAHFRPLPRQGKYLCDVPAIARQRLARAGVTDVTDSGRCTLSEPASFFSHRRDAVTGRMAAFVWIAPER